MAEVEGGCLCGAVRYRLRSEPFDAGYCHCVQCRRSAGAPVMAFATVPIEDLQILRGEPRRRRSSRFGERWFCGDCGTQLAIHVDHQPDTIDFTLGSLDDSDAAATPTFHIFRGEGIGWFDMNDGKPTFEGFRPNTRGL